MIIGTELHVGRAWNGHEIEDACPCPQAECGLAVPGKATEPCEQHYPGSPLSAKTQRQVHWDTDCPGAL